ncbi:MAG: FAD-dependent oxidoreductase [Dokdonella sp.]|uniref:FAD-dependent oxidoreductase n=1 Tax=Dokdonella sp. TaxID=2291710 RepID=UPI003F7D7281
MSETRSIWMRAPMPAIPMLAADIEEDVLVIGAGIAGLSVALSLLPVGRCVTVLERDAIGAGQTLRTSAHLACALDDRFHVLERHHGHDGARVAAQSHARAIDRIEEWCGEFSIACGFARVDGYLVGEGGDPGGLEREFDAARRAGLEVEPVARVPGTGFGSALRFARQARIDPQAYLAGLARAVADLGGSLVRGEATGIEGGDRVDVATAAGQRIRANAVVIATNVPFHEPIAIHTKQAPYRTYVIGCPIPRDAVPDLLLWDMVDPYHYVRRVDDESGASWLIVGGEDHKTGQAPDTAAFERLVEWTRARFPLASAAEWAWSGQVIEPVDGLAFIGHDPGGEANVYVVTGDSGNGLTHGTIAAEVVPALIAGGADPCDGVYDPRRKPLRAAGSWLHENANVAVQYADWVRGGDARPLAPLDGTVVRQGAHRIAVHRDENGELHAFSATCPHPGCSVRWNAIERTFDCPCHGSRFDPCDGRVLNGPAARGLEPIDAGQGHARAR